METGWLLRTADGLRRLVGAVVLAGLAAACALAGFAAHHGRADDRICDVVARVSDPATPAAGQRVAFERVDGRLETLDVGQALRATSAGEGRILASCPRPARH